MADDATFASRRADYENFVQRSQWIAGGVVAVLALGAQLFTPASDALAAAVLTTGLLGGACAAYARVEFAWGASMLELTRQRVDAQPADRLVDRAPPWPQNAENLMVAGLVLLAVAGVLLIVLAWEAAV